MADQKISSLTAVGTPAGTDEFAVNQAGTSKKMTLAQVQAFSGVSPTLIAGASGALSTGAAPSETYQRITANNANITTSTLVTQLTATGCDVGWWLVEYFINWQSAITSTGITFHIDHTGTAVNSQWSRTDPTASQTALATVGISNQASNIGVTGSLPSTWSVRSDAADLGPNSGVDIVDVNQLTMITGLLLVTVTGDLLLRAKSEITSTVTRVAGGTCARYTRLS